MSTTPTIEIVDLTSIVGDHQIACDYNGDLATWGIGDHDDPAKWVMFGKCGDCSRSTVHLSCDRCKSERTHPSASVLCSGCNQMTSPASHFYTRIEAL